MRTKPKVHAIFEGKAICGAKFHPEAEYQFCGHGLHFDMLECDSCKHIVRRHGLLNMSRDHAVQEVIRLHDQFNRMQKDIKRLRRQLISVEARL